MHGHLQGKGDTEIYSINRELLELRMKNELAGQ